MKQVRFEKFLINRGLLENFKYNFFQQNDLVVYEKYKKIYGNKIDAIDLAFDWYSSLEGKVFWQKIHIEWIISLDKNTL